ncbi:hypothetical protein EAT51_15200 [Pseudoxanthomonas winnipegensis]|uniref:hypothetical protein n=1 Tax=Pseudoxanthomonas winnipegensis TaxID=2480810 RepID=UPI00102DE558|nr:hypothetical protein [Pseudoxanthomonas winnipegensis]TAA39548.1 hypothetical protein EAT51_15200 [Pseudoxanthomonas winnipegensis]
MAYVEGTASSYTDLLDKLRNFLTTDADLVNAGRQWQQLRWDNNELILRAPGLDGNQQIHVGARALAFPSLDAYNFGVIGAMSYNAALAFTGQPGTSPERYVPLWNDVIPYTFVANGQRCVVVAKVSTRYIPFYLGYGLPNALTGDYPAPIYVGGCTGGQTDRWSSNDIGFRSFADPGTGCDVLAPSGAWQQVRNFYNSGSGEAEDGAACVWPYAGMATGSTELLRSLRDNGDGTYTAFPLTVMGLQPNPEIYMDLQGCRYVSGFGNAAGTIITIDGVQHLVVPNIFRSDRWGYWLLELT